MTHKNDKEEEKNMKSLVVEWNSFWFQMRIIYWRCPGSIWKPENVKHKEKSFL